MFVLEKKVNYQLATLRPPVVMGPRFREGDDEGRRRLRDYATGSTMRR
jgi:hypothetical protein